MIPLKYMRTSNKGYALFLTILLIILLSITSYALVVSLNHNIRLVREEVEYTKAYYASVASMEYATRLLSHADDIDDINDLEIGESWTIRSSNAGAGEGDGTEFGRDFFSDIGAGEDNRMLEIDIIIKRISQVDAESESDAYTFDDKYYKIDVVASYYN